MRLPVAVVGVGHLGKEHARILASLPAAELVGVVDARPEQAALVAGRCGTRAYTDYRELLGQVSAAVIAAPTSQHHALARDFLKHGVALLVEKPLAAAPEEARDLAALARERGVLLQVGHIERFNPAFEELQRCCLVPRYICCERCGCFTGRGTDVGVVLDLMIHDLDLVLALVRSPVRSVEALGVAVLGGHEDVARARVTFQSGCVADFTAARLAPEPVRRMQVWGAEGFASVDFAQRRLTLIQLAEHLRGADLDSRRLDPAMLASLKAELFGRHLQVQQRDCTSPGGDQLTRELVDFVTCARTGQAPRVGGQAGAEALALAGRILDALAGHAWEGRPDGPVGPHCLPVPEGRLFSPPARQEAA